MASFFDNPTVSFDEWCTRQGITPERRTAKVQAKYQAYKRVNDQRAMQFGAYREAWEDNDAQQKQIQQEYGQRLIAALSVSDGTKKDTDTGFNLRAALNAMIAKGWTHQRSNPAQTFPAGVELALTEGRLYSGQIGQWTSFWKFYRAHKEEKYYNITRKIWEKAAAPVIREHNVAEANRITTTWANVIEKAPAFSQSVKAGIEMRSKPSAKLVEAIKQATGITGTGRQVSSKDGIVPGTGTTAGTPWGTYALVGLVVVGLAVGAYFLFRE